jgi:hypothetical protein
LVLDPSVNPPLTVMNFSSILWVSLNQVFSFIIVVLRQGIICLCLEAYKLWTDTSNLHKINLHHELGLIYPESHSFSVAIFLSIVSDRSASELMRDILSVLHIPRYSIKSVGL